MYRAGVAFWALLSCLLALTWTASASTSSPAATSSSNAAFRAFHSHHHDGTRRCVDIATKETLRLLQGGVGLGVVYYHGEEDATAPGITWSNGRHMLELTAQALRGHDIKVGMVNMERYPSLAAPQGVEVKGTLHVYLGGRTYTYQGLHSPDSLVSFILKLKTPALGKIEGKAHRKAFDRMEGPKLVGLFDKNSSVYAEFQQAAEALHPYVSCHAVFDPKVLEDKETGTELLGVGKHLHLKTPGTILYFNPFQDDPVPLLGEVSVPEIRTFVSTHQRSFLRQIYPYDLYATLEQYRSSRHLVVAFLLPRSPEGLLLFRTLKKLANADVATKEFSSINVLYANMDDFPLMVGTLEQQFGVDLTKPAMGLINITTGEAVWFAGPEELTLSHKDNHQKVVSDWLEQIANGNIRVDGIPPPTGTSQGEEEGPKEDGVDASDDAEPKDQTKSMEPEKEDQSVTEPKEGESRDSDKEQEENKDDDDGEVPDFVTEDDDEEKEEEERAPKVKDAEIDQDEKSEEPEKDEEKKETERSDEASDDKSDKEDDKDDDEDQEDTLSKQPTEEIAQIPEGEDTEEQKEDEDDDDKKEKEDDLKDADLVTDSHMTSEDDVTVTKDDPLEHSKDSAYMRQFYDGDKIFTIVFATLYNVPAGLIGAERWEVRNKWRDVTPEPDVTKETTKKPAKAKKPRRDEADYRNLNYNPNYLRHGVDADKFITNTARFIGSAFTSLLPFQSSAEAPSDGTSPDYKKADKDYRNLNYNPNYLREGGEDDKLMLNSLRFLLKPITYVFPIDILEKPQEKPKRAPRLRRVKKGVIPDADLPDEYFINLPKKPLPSYGDESDKVMTNFLRMIFGFFTYFIPDMPPAAVIPEKRDVPQEPYEPGKLKPLPRYGDESDKVMTNLIKGIYRTATSIFPSQFTYATPDQVSEREGKPEDSHEEDAKVPDTPPDKAGEAEEKQDVDEKKVRDGEKIKVTTAKVKTDKSPIKKGKREKDAKKKEKDAEKLKSGKKKEEIRAKGQVSPQTGHPTEETDKKPSDSMWNFVKKQFTWGKDGATESSLKKEDQHEKEKTPGTYDKIKTFLKNGVQRVKDTVNKVFCKTLLDQDKEVEEVKQEEATDSSLKASIKKPKIKQAKLKQDTQKSPGKMVKQKVAAAKTSPKQVEKKQMKAKPVQGQTVTTPQKVKVSPKKTVKQEPQKSTEKAVKEEKKLKSGKKEKLPKAGVDVSKQSTAKAHEAHKKVRTYEINQEDKLITWFFHSIYTTIKDLIPGKSKTETSPKKDIPTPQQRDTPAKVEPVMPDHVQEAEVDGSEDFLAEAFKGTDDKVEDYDDDDDVGPQSDFLNKAFSSVPESEPLEDGDEFTPKEPSDEDANVEDNHLEHDDHVSKGKYLEELFQDESYNKDAEETTATGETDVIAEDDYDMDFLQDHFAEDRDSADSEAIFTDHGVDDVEIQVEMDDIIQPDTDGPDMETDQSAHEETTDVPDAEDAEEDQAEEPAEEDEDDDDNFLEKAFTSYAADDKKEQMFDDGDDTEAKVFEDSDDTEGNMVDGGTDTEESLFDGDAQSQDQLFDEGDDKEEQLFDDGADTETNVFDNDDEAGENVFDEGDEAGDQLFDEGDETGDQLSDEGGETGDQLFDEADEAEDAGDDLEDNVLDNGNGIEENVVDDVTDTDETVFEEVDEAEDQLSDEEDGTQDQMVEEVDDTEDQTGEDDNDTEDQTVEEDDDTEDQAGEEDDDTEDQEVGDDTEDQEVGDDTEEVSDEGEGEGDDSEEDDNDDVAEVNQYDDEDNDIVGVDSEALTVSESPEEEQTGKDVEEEEEEDEIEEDSIDMAFTTASRDGEADTGKDVARQSKHDEETVGEEEPRPVGDLKAQVPHKQKLTRGSPPKYKSNRLKKHSQKMRYRDVRWHYVPESDDPREPYQREIRLSQDRKGTEEFASLFEHGKAYDRHRGLHGRH